MKLGAPAGFRMPDLEGVVPGTAGPRPRSLDLRTTYFDTRDLRLARWGYSLRHRAGEGWTLKFPNRGSSAALTRAEHLFPANGRRPPAAALDLVRALVREDSLEPVAQLKTRRTLYAVSGPEGELLVEVVDDQVSVIDGRRPARRFRELEVEMKAPGQEPLMEAVVERLRQAGAGRAHPTSKLMRALGPRALEAPEVAVGRLGPDPAPAALVRNAIAASVARLLQHDPGARVGDDPEDLHQARVAFRRLRSDLHTFASLLDPEWVAATRDELRWAGGLLGEVRDAEVLRDRLRDRLESLPGEDRPAGSRLLARLDQARLAARSRLLDGMRSKRYLGLVDRLLSAAARPPFVEGSAPTKEALLASVEAPWARLRSRARDLGPDATDEELHEVRIRAKRSRYAAEAAAPLTARASDFAGAVARLQTILGEHQDAVLAQRWLREQSRRVGTRTALVAGELLAAEGSAAAEARAAWPKAWKAARKRKLRDWMTV